MAHREPQRKPQAFIEVGKELVRSSLVAKLAAEVDDLDLLRRAATRAAALAALMAAGELGPVPVEGPGFGEMVRRAFPGRSLVADEDLLDEDTELVEVVGADGVPGGPSEVEAA